MKKGLGWIVLIFSLLLVFSALGEKHEDAWVMCQPDSEVNVRQFPSTGSLEVARVFPGDHLVLTGKRRGRWYQVSLICEAMEGWVRRDFLSFTEPEVFEGGRIFITTRGKLATRMSIKGNVRKKFKKKGVKVAVYLMADDWSVTDQGYIMTKFLEEWHET